MKPVFCYKGLSGRLFIFGIRPLDVVILLIAAFFIYALSNSLIAGAVFLISGYIIARKTRFRSDGILSLMYYFISVPFLLPVSNKPEYKNEN